MKKLVLILLLTLSVYGYSKDKQTQPTLAIIHTTVIDATGSNALSDMSVLIAGDSIIGIKHSKKLKFKSGTTIIDGKGKYLIPGLWDMHTHICNDSIYFPLMFVNGVTSVRDMFANRDDFPMELEWRRQINTGKLTGPHLYLPLAVFGPNQKWFNGIEVRSKKDVKAFVREAHDSGADFIKVFDLFDPEIFFTLLSEAKKNGIHVAGHCPISLNIAEVAQAGEISFEHLLGVLLASSSKEDSIRKEMVAKAEQEHDSQSDLTHHLYFIQPKEILESYNSVKADQLMEKLKMSGCYMCPNLSLWDGQLKVINSESVLTENQKYVPTKYLKGWSTFQSNNFTVNILPSEYDQYKQFLNRRFEMVKKLNQYGIPFLAGTDVSWGNHNLIPGFSLHDELSLLVDAGLSPMQALQAATRNAAAALDVLKKTGTVERGKKADLVLLDANPLENINNTRKINTVIQDGHVYSRSALDSLLNDVERKVKERQ